MRFTLQPVGEAFLDEAPVVLRMEAPAAADPARLFELLSDPSTWSRWFPNVADGWGEGDRRVVRLSGGGGFDETVLVSDGRRYVWRVDRSSLPVAHALVEAWEVVPGGLPGGAPTAQLSWTFAVDPRLLWAPMRFAQPALAWLMRRAAANLSRLAGG